LAGSVVGDFLFTNWRRFANWLIPSRTTVDPLGPVFVCHRTLDGAAKAKHLAWTLRATGLPVWHDNTDLPPGDTPRRLIQALEGGLSGAVVVVTPDITNSQVVRGLELPRLLELAKDPRFTLAFANTIPDVQDPERPDYEAPDRLLRTQGERPRLRNHHQYRYFNEADAGGIALAMALRRMSLVRESGTKVVDIDIQTRDRHPGAWRHRSPLVVRMAPAEDVKQVPPKEAWESFTPFLEIVPSLLDEAGAEGVLIRGGAHLSAAAALGAALPVTRVWKVAIERQDGLWRDEVDRPAIPISAELTSHSGQGRIAVLVDCADTPAHRTFTGFVTKHDEGFASSVVLSTNGCHLDPADAAATADELARLIRAEAVNQGALSVDLCLRTPFPLAVMLGRRLNTLELTLYEWEPADGPRYVPTLTVASGRGSLVLAVHDRPASDIKE
jgi:hypothetical protein